MPRRCREHFFSLLPVPDAAVDAAASPPPLPYTHPFHFVYQRSTAGAAVVPLAQEQRQTPIKTMATGASQMTCAGEGNPPLPAHGPVAWWWGSERGAPPTPLARAAAADHQVVERR